MEGPRPVHGWDDAGDQPRFGPLLARLCVVQRDGPADGRGGPMMTGVGAGGSGVVVLRVGRVDPRDVP